MLEKSPDSLSRWGTVTLKTVNERRPKTISLGGWASSACVLILKVIPVYHV